MVVGEVVRWRQRTMGGTYFPVFAIKGFGVGFPVVAGGCCRDVEEVFNRSLERHDLLGLGEFLVEWCNIGFLSV